MADRRPGTAAATELLHMSDLSEWRDMFDNYSDAVCRVAVAKKKSELVELDAWLWGDFPRLVRDRSPAYCTKDELFRIMQWKLLRGKNRPALLGLIQQNSEATVRSVSQSAFRSLLSAEGENNRSWKAALTKLAELRGVGPATASAILSPLVPSVPFMADEVLEAVTNGKREYTLAAYECMQEELQGISKNMLQGQLSPEEAGKALWTAAMMSVHPPTAGSGSGTGLKSKSKVANENSTKSEIISTSLPPSQECVVLPLKTNKRKTPSSTDSEMMKSKDEANEKTASDARAARRMKRARAE